MHITTSEDTSTPTKATIMDNESITLTVLVVAVVLGTAAAVVVPGPTQ